MVVQLNLTPEIEVFYILFDRSLSIFSMTFLRQHLEYFNFRCKIQLDLPVERSGCKLHWQSSTKSCVLSEKSTKGAFIIRDNSRPQVRVADGRAEYWIWISCLRTSLGRMGEGRWRWVFSYPGCLTSILWRVHFSLRGCVKLALTSEVGGGIHATS